MAVGDVTIAQVLGATPAIPAVVLQYFGDSGYQPGEVSGTELAGFTQSWRGIFEGTGRPEIRTWALGGRLPFLDFVRLNELIRWQNTEIAAERDGRLQITDEISYPTPRPIPHPFTLVPGSQVETRPGYETGYSIHRCFVAKGQGHGLPGGRGNDGSIWWIFALVVTEVSE
ncbi:hypothetical protein [Vacuolonema iberomarrocanum]|uniref:hypothetical protein n=1 Tax=Vacuolonema iberomarrocanum TaxID=3454632 RepID=UPI0019E3FD62|nr:hypothetical protein [filamentous cyanobacterium LEGE 07170]